MCAYESITVRHLKKRSTLQDGTMCCICVKKGTNKTVVVTGHDLPTSKDLFYTVYGRSGVSKKGNAFFDAYIVEVCPPKDQKTFVAYMGSLRVGVGSSRASLIYDTLGEDAYNALQNDPKVIHSVNGIPKKLADRIEKKITIIKIRNLLLWKFGGAGSAFTPQKAWSVAKKLGLESMELINKNPYLLCRLTGLSFQTVDQMARATMDGVCGNHAFRLYCAVRCALVAAESQGHVCLPEDVLAERVMKLCNYRNSGFADISMIVAQVAIKSLLNKMLIRKTGNMVYRCERYLEERKMAAQIVHLMRSPVRNEERVRLNINEVLNQYMEQNDIQLAPQQEKAVLNAFVNPVSIVTGGPGTGKTTLVKAILAMDKFILGDASNPMLLAPTGRAARRLCETSGHSASTVHSAIGYRGDDEGEVDGITLNPSLIIVDEVSMLDQTVAAILISKIEVGTRLVLVGDADQLPSVGAGNVLAELIASKVIPTTRLETIFRQTGGEENPIVVNAKKINEGETDLVYSDRFMKVQISDSERMIQYLCKAYVNTVKEYGIDSVIMLVPYRSSKTTKICTEELNRRVQSILNPLQDGEAHLRNATGVYHAGDLVMHLKNSEDAQNGDIGIVESVVKAQSNETVMTVDFGDFKKDYTQENIMDLCHAYACTIHKAQGAEYRFVLMGLSLEHSFLLQRNLLYTGITRATSKVCLVGNLEGRGSALEKSILNNKADVRYSMLGLRIQSGWREYLNKKQNENVQEESSGTVSEHFQQETLYSVSQAG